MSASQPKEYTIYVRIPGWATPNPVVSVNGKRVSEAVQPGTFASIRRTWNDGDRVELELPMPLRLEQVDANHPNMVALVQGPLVLFAVAESQPSFDRKRCCKRRPPTMPRETGRQLSRRQQGDDAPVHEYRQGKLQHVRNAEILSTVAG